MERYALDLAALARVAYDPGTSPDLKSRATTVCAAHAQDLGKYIGKLEANIRLALPIAEKKKRTSSRPAAAVSAIQDPAEKAKQISAVSRSISRRVYLFIHPSISLLDWTNYVIPAFLNLWNRFAEWFRIFKSIFQGPLAGSGHQSPVDSPRLSGVTCINPVSDAGYEYCSSVKHLHLWKSELHESKR